MEDCSAAKSSVSSVKISSPSQGDFRIGEGSLVILAGPCVIESEAQTLRHAEKLSDICRRIELPLVFKSSFDKANRTSKDSFRGVGFEQGLSILSKVKSEFGVPVVSDIHLPEQATPAAEVLDILQIPAFLCRQSDLIESAGRTQRVVMIKKGQFLAPEDMQYAAEKVASKKVILCERGSCFGYRNLIVDMRSLIIMRSLGLPVVFDATHSVQIMGGAGGKSSGAREFVVPLAKAAVAVGIDALFLECHENPESAPSDGPNMLPMSEVEPTLKLLQRIREAL